MKKIKKILTTLLVLNSFMILNADPQDEDFMNELLDSLSQEEIAEPLKSQKELTIIQPAVPLNLDPHTSAYTGEAQVLNSLYEGLFSYNAATADPEYALAVEYQTSRDQLFWTFKLRKGAKFSNGKKITANDIKESWLNLISTPGAYYSSFLDVIKGAREYRLGKGKREDVAIFAEGDSELGIELISPISHFPRILCHHAFAAVDAKDGAYSGPYKLTSYDNSKLCLEKNEYYYNCENVKIKNITILFSDDADNNAHLFNNGMAHWITSECNTRKILDPDSIKFEPLFGTYYFFFKNGNSKYLTEDVRIALMDATPWKELREGSLFPATTLVYPLSGYKQPAPLNYTDYAHAKAMMKRAKKKLGLKEEELIELTFAIPQGDSIKQAAEILKKSWARVGVKLNIHVIKSPSYLTSISKTKADLFIYTWIGDFADPIAFLELFKSDSSLNESKWSNKEFDRLLDLANSTSNKEERFKYLSEAENILLSSGVIIPLTHSIDLNIINMRELSGWAPNPLDIHPFKNIFFKKTRSTFKHGTVAKK